MRKEITETEEKGIKNSKKTRVGSKRNSEKELRRGYKNTRIKQIQ